MFIRNNRSKLTTFAYGVFLMLRQKEKWFINFSFFYHFPKEYVGRVIQNDRICCEHELYINSKIIKGSIS